MLARLTASLLLCLYVLGTQASQSFQLLNGNWNPALIQRTDSGWQHVYLCQSCRFTPSLTINTSTHPEPDEAFLHELERSFQQVSIEQESRDLIRSFTIFRAFQALDPSGPEKLTVVSTRLPSSDGRYWHHIQAVIEQGAMSEDVILESQWISLLTLAQMDGNSLIINGDQPTKYRPVIPG